VVTVGSEYNLTVLWPFVEKVYVKLYIYFLAILWNRLVISCMNAVCCKQFYCMLTDKIKTLEQETDLYMYPNIKLNMKVIMAVEKIKHESHHGSGGIKEQN
jgi:hypothetical protein